MIPRSVTLVAAFFGAVSFLAAQDTRTVIEPFFPQLCTTLDAQLQSHGHTLAPDGRAEARHRAHSKGH